MTSKGGAFFGSVLNCTSPVHSNVDFWSCLLASVLCNTCEHSLKDQQPCRPACPVSVRSHIGVVIVISLWLT